MLLFVWFIFLATLALYYRFLSILFEHLNEEKALKILYSVVGIFVTFVLAKFIQFFLSGGQPNPGTDEAVDYAVWFGITIGLIIIYEAILRIIIIRKDFQEIQHQRKFEEIESLMYKVDEHIKRGKWKKAQQLYAAIETFDIDKVEIVLRCLEFAEKHESMGNLEASQLWYEIAGQSS